MPDGPPAAHLRGSGGDADRLKDLGTHSPSGGPPRVTLNHDHPHPASHSNHCLIWRGSILNQNGLKLHGLAIVADSAGIKASHGRRDDPFLAKSSFQSLSDTCLEIKMLRSLDLHVRRAVQLVETPRKNLPLKFEPHHSNRTNARKAQLASLLKGKGEGAGHKLDAIPLSDVDCDPEVRLYVDPRCGQTRRWLMSQLCNADLTPTGLTTDALVISLDRPSDSKPSQELVIFAKRAETPLAHSPASPPAIGLQLCIGQLISRQSPRIPRPDDPFPRLAPTLPLQAPGVNRFDKLSTFSPSTLPKRVINTPGRHSGPRPFRKAVPLSEPSKKSEPVAGPTEMVYKLPRLLGPVEEDEAIDSSPTSEALMLPPSRASKTGHSKRDGLGNSGDEESHHRPQADAEGLRGSNDSLTCLKQNKILIRKVAMESLRSRAIDKADDRFKDLFAAICRGVQFAVRRDINSKPIDQTLIKSFVEGHLAMYMVL